MKNRAAGKRKLLATAAVACLAVALAAAPAYAFWYVHGDAHVSSSEGQGVYEVLVTFDEGGTERHTEQVFVPQGSTAEDVLDEDIHMSESQNGIKAIHDYSYQSLREYLDGKDYTIKVYHAESQKPGTQTTHDGKSTGDGSTTLERYDNVVVTVK